MLTALLPIRNDSVNMIVPTSKIFADQKRQPDHSLSLSCVQCLIQSNRAILRKRSVDIIGKHRTMLRPQPRKHLLLNNLWLHN